MPRPAGRVPVPEIAALTFSPPARYDSAMTSVVTVAISLPQEQVEQAREAVARGEAASVSGYISTALAAMSPASAVDDEDTLTDLVADLMAEFGRPSQESYAWADEVLGLTDSDDTCAGSTRA